MHWTSALSGRGMPPNAVVVDDVYCGGCGYNLRGLRAVGVCPECAKPVRDSLTRLTRPERVSSALGSLSKSYLGYFAIIVIAASIPIGLTFPIWIALLVLFAASLVRFVSICELRYAAAIDRLPDVAPRVTAAWWIMLLELILILLVAAAPGAIFVNAPRAAAWLLWIVAAAGSLVLGAQIGIALARLLEYDSILRELRIGQYILFAGVGAIVLTIVAQLSLSALPPRNSTGADAIVLVMVLTCGLLWSIAIALTFTGLARLSLASTSALGTAEDVVEIDESIAPPSRPSAPDLPDIEVEHLEPN